MNPQSMQNISHTSCRARCSLPRRYKSYRYATPSARPTAKRESDTRHVDMIFVLTLCLPGFLYQYMCSCLRDVPLAAALASSTCTRRHTTRRFSPATVTMKSSAGSSPPSTTLSLTLAT